MSQTPCSGWRELGEAFFDGWCSERMAVFKQEYRFKGFRSTRVPEIDGGETQANPDVMLRWLYVLHSRVSGLHIMSIARIWPSRDKGLDGKRKRREVDAP